MASGISGLGVSYMIRWSFVNRSLLVISVVVATATETVAQNQPPQPAPVYTTLICTKTSNDSYKDLGPVSFSEIPPIVFIGSQRIRPGNYAVTATTVGLRVIQTGHGDAYDATIRRSDGAYRLVLVGSGMQVSSGICRIQPRSF